MAWIWGGLASLEPAFRTVTDSSDPAIRALMKVPASLADIGIAATVAWWFRDRRLGCLGGGAVLLWPVTWYVSAWWGQYESIYVLPAVLAVVAARAGRPGWVAVFVVLSVMTKPQALPLLVPFAAWFLGSVGLRGTLRAALIGAVVAVLVWLPFLAAGGPVNYLDNLRDVPERHLQRPVAPGVEPVVDPPGGRAAAFVSDTTAVLGPLTFRYLGFIVTGLLALVVFLGVYRRPTPERLVLGLAAVTLAAFIGLPRCTSGTPTRRSCSC